MAIADLIENLQNLTGPDRGIDKDVAMVAGYRRKIDESTGTKVVTWAHKSEPNVELSSLPRFTENLGDAYNLATRVFPNRDGGFVYFPDGTGRATLDGIPPCDGASPAIAICIAVLTAIEMKR